MNLHLLPFRTGSAAENMATDFLLLSRHPAPTEARFRHYAWRSPAFTFGYSQKIAFVRAQLPAGEHVELCRRPTGGGVVDHRHDWTYTLILPRGHALYDGRATETYRVIHAALTDTLVALGQPAELKKVCEAPEEGDGCPPGPGVCFQRAELYDVVNRTTGRKIAGAAMKRNKHGILTQGSIEKGSVGAIDWDEFGARFVAALAAATAAPAVETGWPELNDEELSALTEQYATPEWIEQR